ncbi:unnamed protein product [Trichogramma brassicae]|uniref:Uncharacterized protein n=1 Tax=Trichogramma brassicae TaxID=86971 RepID=A0A6H5IAC4_9HYME|nr:unnamed protein product [Trichogramma brassicae]
MVYIIAANPLNWTQKSSIGSRNKSSLGAAPAPSQSRKTPNSEVVARLIWHLGVPESASQSELLSAHHLVLHHYINREYRNYMSIMYREKNVRCKAPSTNA